MFETVEELKEALRLLKSKLKVPEKAEGRCVALHNGLKGSVVLSIEKSLDRLERQEPLVLKLLD